MIERDFEAEYEKIKVLKKLKANIAMFGRICFPTAFKEHSPSFHKEILDTVANDDYKRVLCAAPRGTAKSTILSFLYPVWRLAFKKTNEELFIVIISEARQQSINFLSRIKFHLDNSETFIGLFGNLGEDTAKKWREDDIVLANGTRIMAVGTGQKVRGFISRDTRPNLIIVDDFESEKNAFTAEGRVKNKKWLTEAVEPSLSKDGRLLMIGTVISEDCFLFWAKDNPPWKTLWYTIWDDDQNPVWPEMYPKERIMQIRDSMASVGNLGGFFQEYMNQPQSPEEAPFKPGYIKLHHKTHKKINGQHCLIQKEGGKDVITPVELYAGIDPASSLKRTADYFVIATLALDADENVYIVDLTRTRLNPADQPQMIIDKYKKFTPKRMRIETVGYQEALRQHTRRLMKEQGLHIPGLEKGIRPRNSKSERLLSLVPLLASGRFYFRPEDLEAQKEFLSYPKGRNDDVMDAVYMALDGAKPCRVKNLSLDKKEDSIIFNKVIDWLTQ